MSYPFSGLSNYSGNYQAATAQPGLACYGQSLSSENLDFTGLTPTFAPSFNCGYQPSYVNCNGLDPNDPKLLQQIDQIVAGLNECKRPILRRQVITVPSQCPGRIAYVTRRLPTPPPDIIERITVVKPQRDVVNLCIEKPTQPGPCYQERNICGKPRKPIIQPRIITVNPRTNPCAPPPCVPCPPPCMPCPPPPCIPCPPQYNPCNPCGPPPCNPCGPPPCNPCGPPPCNPCGPPPCNPCGPPPCNPCTPITYIPPGQNFQAQVPLSPSPSSTSLSEANTQPPVSSLQAFTSQAYSQPQLTNPYSAPNYAQQALQQALTQQALQQAAYPQAAYAQQAAYQQQQQAAYAQQAAYQQQQAAYQQQQQQQAYSQPQAYAPQQQQGYYPQQQPGQSPY